MFNFFRKHNYFDYEIIYRYGSRPFFSRLVVRASSKYEAQRNFDANPSFTGCTRICDAVIFDSHF